MKLINQYKRTDVFTCNFSSHKKYANRVSVYHVMRKKKCYPQGCIFFKWHCIRLRKGQSCIRGYQFMGRKCEGCRYFEDEKEHFQPQARLGELEYKEFLQELESFEEWLAENQDQELVIFGSIDSVKPRFQKVIGRKMSQVYLHGYIVIFRDGFIGNTEFNDYFYLIVTPHQQERWQLVRDDRLECRGKLRLDEGRLVFERIHALEFETRSGLTAWDNSQALVSRRLATNFDHQPARCLNCWHGALVDVEDNSKRESQYRRELFCLKGIQQPQDCYLRALALRKQSECPY